MTKPSSDTATERQVVEYRENGTLPNPMTLRFLALLKKQELREIAETLKLKMENYSLPTKDHAGMRRYFRARFLRVQSERQQRGHIK